MDFSFKRKLAFMFLFPACSVLFTLAMVYYFLAGVSANEHLMNMVREQRVLSEQIFAYSHSVSAGKDDYRQDLQDSIQNFDALLHALEYGGIFKGKDLPDVPVSLRNDIKHVKRQWSKSKKRIVSIVNNPLDGFDTQNADESIANNIDLLIQASSNLVFSFQNKIQAQQKKMLEILVFIVLLNIILFIWGGMVLKRYIAGHIRHVQKLENSGKEWRLIFDAIPDFISLHDNDNKILRANKSLANFVGVSPEELVGKNCYDFFNCLTDSSQVCPMQKQCNGNENTTEELDEKATGIPLQITSSPVIDNGEVVASVHVLRDISERKRYEEHLRYHAHHDELTDLPNRTLFVERLKQEISYSHRHQLSFAVLFLDLDRFKLINDTLGHATADALLQDVATRLLTCLREGDTVARQGGDEFVIMLSDLVHKEDAGMVAQKINEAISVPFWLNNRELFITTSIGISIYPDDGEDDQTLIKNADIAMYRAKDMGRDNFQYYQASMGEQARERLALEHELRLALQGDEFDLHYQVRLNLDSGEITGVEALLRWQHPKLGEILPKQFVPLLEETGMIDQVGEWALLTACNQNKAWQMAGFPFMTVSVNLSARQFNNKDLIKRVTDVLVTSELDPCWLELEITESTLLEHKETVVSVLHELGKLGVRLAIDDFGTGYSSLSYLKRFPIHTLKIDRSFIKDVPNDVEDIAITRAIIALAKSLHLNVVAEGVETEQQLSFLREQQCDELQGYYFGQAMTAKMLSSFLHEAQYMGGEHAIHLLAGKTTNEII